MTPARTAVLVLAIAIALPGWSARNLRLGDDAPRLDVDAIKGTIPELGAGGITVVEFWATWCGPCRKTIPHLTRVQEHYRGDGVQVVGISDESDREVRPFVRDMGNQMNYTVAVDQDRATSLAYMGGFNVNTIPHAFLVDGEGRIRWHGHPGAREMIEALDELLEEKNALIDRW